MPGAHKIGAAISGPRFAGGKIADMRLFLTKRRRKDACLWFWGGMGDSGLEGLRG